MQSPHRTHSGELGFTAGSSFRLHAFLQSSQELHFSLLQRILIRAIGFNSAYIAPSGHKTRQKKRYTGTDVISIKTANADFHIKRIPAIFLKGSFTTKRGTAPKTVPDGQTYVQNHGAPKPESS